MLSLMKAIDQVFTAYPFFNSRRIAAFLRGDARAHPWRFSLPPRAILAAGVLLNVSQKHAGAVKSEVSAMPGPELPGPELSVCEIAGTLKPLQDTAAQGDIRPMSSVELKMGERGGGIFFGQFLDHC